MMLSGLLSQDGSGTDEAISMLVLENDLESRGRVIFESGLDSFQELWACRFEGNDSTEIHL